MCVAPCTAAWKCLSVRADEPRGCTLLQHCIAQKTTRSSSVHLLCTSHRPSPLPTMPHETNNPHHADTPLSSPLPSMPLFGVCPSAGQSCEASPPPPPGLIAPLSPRLAEEEEEEEGLRKHGHGKCFILGSVSTYNLSGNTGSVILKVCNNQNNLEKQNCSDWSSDTVRSYHLPIQRDAMAASCSLLAPLFW